MATRDDEVRDDEQLYDDDGEFIDDDEEEFEEEAPRRNIRGLILLAITVLLLCCVGLFGLQMYGLIPGMGGDGNQRPVAKETAAPETEPITDTEVITDTEQMPPEVTDPMTDTEEMPPEATDPMTDTEEMPPEVTDPMTDTEEMSPEVTDPMTDTEEMPSEEPTATPTTTMEDEHDAPLPAEPTTTPTVVVVPGPTSTPTPALPADPTPVPTPVEPPMQPTTPSEQPAAAGSCDNNQAPSAQADGPQQIMMGKGQAMGAFDGTSSTDTDGNIATYEWDFGDGTSASGQQVTHGYGSTGSYAVTLTVTDNCGSSASSTINITVVGPTPPAEQSQSPPATAQPVSQAPLPAGATMGFCHVVQRGQTLSGLARNYGVNWADLAAVNNVPPDYRVAQGESLFIPTGQINQKPYVYRAQNGESLNNIAANCGMGVNNLTSVNNMPADQALAAGQIVTLPF